jgi:hypothetical protein
MALGTAHVILSEVPNFVPQLWSDEVLASYKSNLVMANLVRKLNHRGKKGSSIKIPTPSRGAVSSKTAETQVTLIQHGTDTGLTINIANQLQAKSTARRRSLTRLSATAAQRGTRQLTLTRVTLLT